jgi:hypothetical protein
MALSNFLLFLRFGGKEKPGRLEKISTATKKNVGYGNWF